MLICCGGGDGGGRWSCRDRESLVNRDQLQYKPKLAIACPRPSEHGAETFSNRSDVTHTILSEEIAVQGGLCTCSHHGGGLPRGALPLGSIGLRLDAEATSRLVCHTTAWWRGGRH